MAAQSQALSQLSQKERSELNSYIQNKWGFLKNIININSFFAGPVEETFNNAPPPAPVKTDEDIFGKHMPNLEKEIGPDVASIPHDIGYDHDTPAPVEPEKKKKPLTNLEREIVPEVAGIPHDIHAHDTLNHEAPSDNLDDFDRQAHELQEHMIA
jgi:hypothetical protein